MTTQSLSQNPIPGAFIVSAPESAYTSGVLAEAAAGLGDGAILRHTGDVPSGLLIAWTGVGSVAGILVQPDGAEIRSGRRRVTFVNARGAEVVFEALALPEGFETEALAGLRALGINVRTADGGEPVIPEPPTTEESTEG